MCSEVIRRAGEKRTGGRRGQRGGAGRSPGGARHLFRNIDRSEWPSSVPGGSRRGDLELCSAEAMLHTTVGGKTEIVVGDGSSVFQTLPVSWLQKSQPWSFLDVQIPGSHLQRVRFRRANVGIRNLNF